ncbi:MAG: type II toxin-antitoxin system PemK/MazF family toxin [Trichococcus sp.]|uniref:type II toxin-antitoxin system PemK/MazF family toxin n=1 Tax=Trichococcus sp. TaxID=1985464 RepID=UPI003C4B607E
MRLSDSTGETAIEQVGENFQVQGTPVVRKGDIWLANLGTSNFVGCEQKGYRPEVVIQNNLGNKASI